MPRLSYEEVREEQLQSETRNTMPQINFFALKNDGDKALVRIMHSTTADFDIMAVHEVVINDKRRKVNCLRDPKEPIENCPLCAVDNKLRQQVYVHLLRYTKKEDGTVESSAQIWERPISFIKKLKNLCDEYKNLPDYLFTIKRNGVAGSRETTYDIMFAPPGVYSDDVYKKDPTAFNNIHALGVMVLDRTYDEMKRLIGEDNEEEVKEHPKSDEVEEFKDNNLSAATIDPIVTPNEVFGENKEKLEESEQIGARTYQPDNLDSVNTTMRPIRTYNVDN